MVLHCAVTLHHLELAEVLITDGGTSSCELVFKALEAWTEINSSEILDTSVGYNDNVMP